MIGLLEIRRRKFQFALIALIVTLITYLVLMVNGLGVGLNELSGRALKNFNADAIAYSDKANLSVVRSEMSREAVDRAAALPGVTAGTPIGYFAVNIRKLDGSNAKVKSAAMIGYDSGTIGEPDVTGGRKLAAGEGDAILADKSFLKLTDLKVGDSVTLAYRLTSRSFRIVGEIDQGAFFFQPTIYALRSTWQEMKYGDNAPGQPAASIVLLKGKALPGLSGDGYRIVDKETAFNNIEGVTSQQSTVNALAAFGYLIGALVIGVFFYVLTLQKVAQIGMLKALGASGFFVFRQLLVQVFVLAIVGVGAAVPLAWLTNNGLQRLPETVPVAFTTRTFVVTSIAMVITALVGAIFSGRQVAKVDPIVALGQQQ